jgi:hypothetical protein
MNIPRYDSALSTIDGLRNAVGLRGDDGRAAQRETQYDDEAKGPE